jgi:hypothetical protein
MLKQLRHGKTDISCNLPKKNGRDIAARVERYGRCAACAVTKLLVRTALAYLNKAQALQDRDNFGGLEDRDIAHDSGDRDVLNPNEFRFKNWLTVLEKHRKDFTKISVQFVERRALRVCAGKPGTKPTKRLVSGSRSITAEYVFMAWLRKMNGYYRARAVSAQMSRP